MGIRIHKMIGYGFCDLVENDPRIDWDRLAEVREMDTEEFDTYLKLVDSRSSVDIDLMLYWRRPDDQKRWNFSDVITYDSEFGLSNVILFGNPCMPKWSRYDDPIDYYSSAARKNGCEPSYERLSMGIWPYMSPKLIHIDTGQTANEDQLRRLRYLKDQITLSGGHIYEYHEDFENDFLHEQSDLVKHIARFSGVREENLHQLVPLLYEYWA